MKRAPVLFCACFMMVLATINQEFGLPNIDAFMVEHRSNPDGAKESDVKGEFDMNGILISGETVVKKERMIKKFMAIIPGRIGPDFKGTVDWCCLTGTAQTAIVWGRLYELTGNSACRNAIAA